MKNDVSIDETEKKNKANELKSQAENAKQKIQEEIKALEAETGTDKNKEKAEAQALLDSFSEIIALHASILNP